MSKNSSHEITFLYDDINSESKEGLVGLGKKIVPELILKYYPKGIFPWFRTVENSYWFSPNPRWILYPEKVKISDSLKSLLRKNKFTVRADTCFEDVLNACASSKNRKDTELGTWIDKEFKSCFMKLHQMEFAHSIEVFMNNRLVGGLFGISIGRMFSGESMFYLESGASKVELVNLCRFLKHHGYEFIDCQTHTPHLESMGAEPIPRKKYLSLVEIASKQKGLSGLWQGVFEKWMEHDMNHSDI